MNTIPIRFIFIEILNKWCRILTFFLVACICVSTIALKRRLRHVRKGGGAIVCGKQPMTCPINEDDLDEEEIRVLLMN